MSWLAVKADMTAVPFGNYLGDRQSEAGSTLAAGVRGICLGELAEDMRAEIIRNPRAMVNKIVASRGYESRFA